MVVTYYVYENTFLLERIKADDTYTTVLLQALDFIGQMIIHFVWLIYSVSLFCVSLTTYVACITAIQGVHIP